MAVMTSPISVDLSCCYNMFHSKGVIGLNHGAYSNPLVDDLLDQAEKLYDFGQRRQVYAQLQQELSRDLPRIFLFSSYQTAAAVKELENVTPPQLPFRPNSSALWRWRE